MDEIEKAKAMARVVIALLCDGDYRNTHSKARAMAQDVTVEDLQNFAGLAYDNV